MPLADAAVIEKIVLLLGGALLGWLLQQYRVARSEDVALLNEHIKDIEKFVESAQTYWLTAPETAEKDRTLAAKVRAAHAATSLAYPKIKTICGSRGDLYRHLSIDLFDHATGQNFEGKDRSFDPERAIDLHLAGAKLIHELRLSRTYIVSLRRLWDGIQALPRPKARLFDEGKNTL